MKIAYYVLFSTVDEQMYVIFLTISYKDAPKGVKSLIDLSPR